MRIWNLEVHRAECRAVSKCPKNKWHSARWLAFLFMKGGKSENPEKNPRSKDKNQQQTQPTYDAESGNRTATLVGGKCPHPCAMRAPALTYRTIFRPCNLEEFVEPSKDSTSGEKKKFIKMAFKLDRTHQGTMKYRFMAFLSRIIFCFSLETSVRRES